MKLFLAALFLVSTIFPVRAEGTKEFMRKYGNGDDLISRVYSCCRRIALTLFIARLCIRNGNQRHRQCRCEDCSSWPCPGNSQGYFLHFAPK